MAKQRASLPLPRSSASDTSESESTSTGSNINVEMEALSGSVDLAGSHISTPPTSVPDSISDAASDKHSIMMHSASVKAENDGLSRRSSRRTSGPTTYNVAALSGVKRNKSVENLKSKDIRSFSGQTLVNDADSEPMTATSADTPRRKLLDEGLKTLDMDWDVGQLGGESSTAAVRSPAKPMKRKSTTFEKISEAVTKVTNKVLGKRTRDETESSTTAARRQSRRISTLATAPKQEDAADDDDLPARPSKIARVASNFSLPSLSSTFHLTKTKTPVTKLVNPVKKYQKQGLYVGQKQDSKPDGKKTKRPTSSHSSTSDVPAKQPAMPLPMFDYMERERSFVIPYGIFAPQFRGRGEEKPKDWGKINKNRFVGDAKDEWHTHKLQASVCICKAGDCGDDCWNRVMGVECDDRNCNVGPDCGNRDFEQLSARMARANKYDKKTLAYLYNAGVEVIKTSDRGFGVRACRSFEPGEIITEYTGEIITQKEAHRRVTEEYSGKSDYYQMEFDQGMILDATRGSLARFVNHCCDPNCEMVKRTVAGQPRMALFAGDNGIMAGQELTYDYNFDPYSTTNVQKCLCGASNCRQILGPKPAGEKKPSTRKEQLDMATDLVQRTVSNGASNKRKAGSLFVDDNSAAIAIPKELIKKRKVPQMSKGWAYVDEDMERQRREEAEKDRLLKQLQREGIVGEDISIERPKYPSRGAKMVEKIKTTLTGGGSGSRPKTSSSSKTERPKSSASSKERPKSWAGPVVAKDDELKLNKGSMMSRVGDSIRQRKSGGIIAEPTKRRSLLEVGGTWRQHQNLMQSKLNFGSVSGGSAGRSVSGEALLKRTVSGASAGSKGGKGGKVDKRASVVSKASKRASTVRVVGPDE